MHKHDLNMYEKRGRHLDAVWIFIIMLFVLLQLASLLLTIIRASSIHITVVYSMPKTKQVRVCRKSLMAGMKGRKKPATNEEGEGE